MAITIIVTNNTSSSINLDDLGVDLAMSEIRTLTDTFDFKELVESNDLRSNVSDGKIGVNDGTSDLSITDGLAHLTIESAYQDLEQDESISGVIATELSSIQVRNNTSWQISNTWTDVSYPDIIFQNNTNVLEQDASFNDRINIKKDGIYNISTTYSIRSNSNSLDSFFRTRVNDSTVIIDERKMNTYNGEIQEHSDNAIIELNQGDYVSSQVHVNGNDSINILYTSLKITRMEGVKGDDGPPGGTTVTIQEDDVNVVTNTNIINFEGDSVSVVNEGSNKATVIINSSPHVFKYVNIYDSSGNVNLNVNSPSSYDFNSQLIRDVDTFNHSTVSNKSRLIVLKSGWYKVSYSLNYYNDNYNRKNIKCVIRTNGSSYIESSTSTSYIRNTTDEYGTISCQNLLIHLNTNDYIELMYNREGSSGDAISYANQCWLQLEFCRED